MKASEPGTKREAQTRVDRVRAFEQELSALESAEILSLAETDRARVEEYHQGLFASLSERFDVDLDPGQKQLSWGMRITATLAAMALGAGVFFLFYRFWGHLGTPVQVAILVGSPVLALGTGEWISRREKTRYFTALSGLVAFVCFVIDLQGLGRIFNIAPTPNAMLALGVFALCMAYAWRVRVLLLAAILSLLGWLSAVIGTWSGCYWLSFGERPENFVLAGLALFLVGAIAHRRGPEGFASDYRLWGGLTVLLAVLILSNFGRISYLPMGRTAVEIFYQCAGFALCTLLIWWGGRMNWGESAKLGVTFFVLQLYTKFFDWFWDLMPRYLFFLFMGGIGVGVLVILRYVRAHRKDEVSA